MKLTTKLIALVPLLTACSATISNETTTLTKLPTTVIPVIDTIPGEEITYTPEQYAFFDDVVYYYGASPEIGNDELLAIGELWCKLMTEGMSAQDVIGRINEGSSDNADALLHFSIVNSGIENLCPSQWDKAEEIALNSFLP